MEKTFPVFVVLSTTVNLLQTIAFIFHVGIGGILGLLRYFKCKSYVDCHYCVTFTKCHNVPVFHITNCLYTLVARLLAMTVNGPKGVVGLNTISHSHLKITLHFMWYS